ncbi:hypothetical protein ACLB2K_077214 [Fragaria x ananassa]
MVMGRGAAIYVSSRFRIATENSIFSMPETALGGVPENSYFLSRLPRFLGEYLALTGAQLDGPEMLACGIATHFVPAAELAMLEQELLASIGALTRETTSSCDDLISYASPISLKIALRSIREGRSQGPGECLVQEYRIACRIGRGEISTDFREGFTALLVDMDRVKKWEPSELELVSDQMADRYFPKLEDDDK